MFIKLRENKAFTLVEIMIVVAIIGLLIAIALPNFVKARETTRKNLCFNNMRLLGHGAEQEDIDTGLAVTDITTLGSYVKGGLPHCPNAAATNYGIANTVLADGGRSYQITCPAATTHGTYDTATGKVTLPEE